MKNMIARLLCVCTSAVLVAAAGPRVAAQSASPLTNLLGQLKTTSASSGDATLNSVGSELSSKANALNTSLAGKPETQGQLAGAMQSLLGNKGGESLAAFQKLSQAKLTPEQTK